MSLSKHDIVFTGGVSILACYQLAHFAKLVGASRRKHKIEPPVVSGPEEFNRVFRAQQNSLEYFPMFMGTMWTSAIFLHQVPASLVGLIYLYSRQKYVDSYTRNAKDRVGPFKLGVNCLKAFLLMSVVGVANTVSTHYFDYDVIGMLINKIGLWKE